MAGWYDILKRLQHPDSGIPETASREELEAHRERIADALDLLPRSQEISKAFEEFLRLPKPYVATITPVAIDDNEVQAAWTQSTNRYYWERLRRFLTEQVNWSAEAVLQLDEGSEKVLQRLQPPGEHGEKRGVVIGYVQSGKTANMAATICKAVDCGYRLIVILAGTLENLRQQTQSRFDRELVGNLTGVLYDKPCVIKEPNVRPDWQTLTHSDAVEGIHGDIIGGGAQLVDTPPGGPILAVVKKNRSRLARLKRKLQTLPGWENLPCLVIDDESDSASINTMTARGKERVTATNRAIREFLTSFSSRSYVGYTATPYANLFIDATADSPTLGPDLFPRDFMVLLRRPGQYVGARQYFGIRRIAEEDRSETRLPVFCEFAEADDATVEGLSKAKSLPEAKSLYHAVLCFLLSCAARTLRGQGDQHMTMLINPGALVDNHDTLRRPVKAFIQRFAAKGRPTTLDDLPSELRNDLRAVWTKYFAGDADCLTSIAAVAERLRELSEEDGVLSSYPIDTCVKPPFEDVVAEVPAILGSIEVLALNGRTSSKLNYESSKTPLRYIVVGGNKLSRGLTLEGLSISYFLRAPAVPCYDTLMQMGRWFGYRSGYLDLCRIWALPETIENFAQIAAADEALRNLIESQRSQLRPVDVPPYIFKFDGMNVVAANKLGAAVQLSALGVRLEQTRPPFRREVVAEQNAAWGNVLAKHFQFKPLGGALVSTQTVDSKTLDLMLRGIETTNLNLQPLRDLVARDGGSVRWRIIVEGRSSGSQDAEQWTLPSVEMPVVPVTRSAVVFGSLSAPSGIGFKAVGTSHEGSVVGDAVEAGIPAHLRGYVFLYPVRVRTTDPNLITKPEKRAVLEQLELLGYESEADVPVMLVTTLQMPTSGIVGQGDFIGQPMPELELSEDE